MQNQEKNTELSQKELEVLKIKARLWELSIQKQKLEAAFKELVEAEQKLIKRGVELEKPEEQEKKEEAK
jgi:hypothetical protein